MLGQELRWKTLGCGMMMLLVMFCFWGMLSATDGLAKKAKAKKAHAGQSVTQNLEVISIGVASYEADRHELPPTDSSEAFQAALVPTYLADAGVFRDPVSGKSFATNRNIKPKAVWNGVARRNVYLVATPEPSATSTFTVLLLSGEVREVGASELTRLANPRVLTAPAPKPKPAGSPALAPK